MCCVAGVKVGECVCGCVFVCVRVCVFVCGCVCGFAGVCLTASAGCVGVLLGCGCGGATSRGE